MKVYIASDHGGYELKEELKKYLGDLGFVIEDMGAYKLDPADDYTDFVFPVSERVAQNPDSFGIVIGRSGAGEVIAANKIKGIRASFCQNEEMARLAREKNNANVLSLGADFIDIETAKRIVKTFLETPFSGEERHKRRIGKILEYETAQH